VRDDTAAGVPEDNVAQFERLCSAWVLSAHNFAGACGKEETGDQEVDDVVERTRFGWPGGPKPVKIAQELGRDGALTVWGVADVV
jgi:hypothetical protein